MRKISGFFAIWIAKIIILNSHHTIIAVFIIKTDTLNSYKAGDLYIVVGLTFFKSTWLILPSPFKCTVWTLSIVVVNEFLVMHAF